MNNPPEISVLMPVYNGAKTISAAIKSVINQSFENWELIILDDGSNDGTSDFVLESADHRIRYFRFDHRSGIVDMLNYGIQQARGRFIARFDADDICHPERFKKQLTFLLSNPGIDLVGCKTLAVNQDLQPVRILRFAATHQEIFKRPWMGIPLPHPSWFGKREIFEKLGYHKINLAEDQDFLMRARGLAKFAALDEVLLYYRLSVRSIKKEWQYRSGLIKAVNHHYGIAPAALCLAKSIFMISSRKIHKSNRFEGQSLVPF